MNHWRLQHDVPLRARNTFGVDVHAPRLLEVSALDALPAALASLAGAPPLPIGEGSNLLFAGPPTDPLLQVTAAAVRILADDGTRVHLRAEAGLHWHALVEWSLARGLCGLENLALIPGSVGAAPIQNIGAYGVELGEYVIAVEACDAATGRWHRLDRAACAFGYRDSVFKHSLANRTVITRVRLRLPRPWQPVAGYLDIERKMAETGIPAPDARQVFDWICAIRRAKLPDPTRLGNAGSFFKNPIVTPEQCRDIIGRDPEIVHYPLPDGRVKLAAGWMIDACGWKGKSVGQAGVYEKQALVLVNRGGATGSEVMLLAGAIQESVYGRFGIRLEPEPLVV
jgi:UDP-N-acetylmuramate dehydrogenase